MYVGIHVCDYKLVFIYTYYFTQASHELHVVSYIGCGISIFCLILTVTAIVLLRYKAHVFLIVPTYVHIHMYQIKTKL